jgi:hypothetical protein
MKVCRDDSAPDPAKPESSRRNVTVIQLSPDMKFGQIPKFSKSVWRDNPPFVSLLFLNTTKITRYMKYLACSVLALASMVILAPASKAQVSYTAGDLLVGFTSSTASSDYLVDLGNFSQFKAGGVDATGSPVVILSGSQFTGDLGGAGLSSGQFGVFGTVATGGVFAVFGTETESAPGIQTAGQKPPTLSGFNTPNAAFASMANQFASGADTNHSPANQTLGTLPQSVIQNISASGGNPNIAPTSYLSELQPANAFGYFSTPYQGNYSLTAAGDVLDLYQDTRSASTGTLLGEFQINNGELLFDSASPASASFPLTAGSPIPEPATIGFGLAMLGACVVRRRGTVAAIA